MSLRTISALGAALFISITTLAAQSATPAKQLACSEDSHGNRSRVCEMREMNVAAASKLSVNAAPNGGITVKSWPQAGILVRARVEAWGDTDADARKRMSEVLVLTDGANVRAEGPKSLRGNNGWSVSYEVFVPERMDLALNTVNGGISVTGVRGAMDLETVNGGVNLAAVAGRVKGETVNGGVKVALEGTTWDGEGFDISTTNGGVGGDVPANYSARFEAKTTNGGLNADIPNAKVTGRQWGPRSLEATSGSGGPLLKVSTTNGGVKIRQKS